MSVKKCVWPEVDLEEGLEDDDIRIRDSLSDDIVKNGTGNGGLEMVPEEPNAASHKLRLSNVLNDASKSTSKLKLGPSRSSSKKPLLSRKTSNSQKSPAPLPRNSRKNLLKRVLTRTNTDVSQSVVESDHDVSVLESASQQLALP